MRVRIVSPRWSKYPHWSYHMSLLGPLTVAGLCPPDWQVAYTDEQVEPVDLTERPDAVLVSAMTAQAAGAYRICDAFRAAGVPVVIGGIHATLLPDEAAAHADAVVVGEAEMVWPELQADLAAGRLRPRYVASLHPERSCFVPSLPRRDLLKIEGYTVTLEGRRAIDTLQTSRGCVRGCEHCNVPGIFGSRIRSRPVSEVVREIATVEAKYIFLVDDYLRGNRAYLMDLMRRMAPLGRRWLSVGELSLAEDEEFMDAIAASGCAFFYIGFDRLDTRWKEEAMQRVDDDAYRRELKKYDVDFDNAFLREKARYIEAVRRLQERGIGIFGTFVFGFDQDERSIFERTVEFALEARLDLADFAVLTPYPRSPLAQRLEREGRILTRDWSRYDSCHAVFRPARMTTAELEAGTAWAWDEFYRNEGLLRRLARVFKPRSPSRRPGA